MTCYETFFIGTSNEIEIEGLKDDEAGLYENAATITITANHLNGNPVGGVSWPLVFDYEEGTNGNYELEFPHGMQLIPGDRFNVTVLAISPTNRRKRWDLRFIAQLDRQCKT
jgi:hypothetical protein